MSGGAPGARYDALQASQRLQNIQQGSSGGNWLTDALGTDFQRALDAIKSGVMAPMNALTGGYNQRTIDPTTGAVSPVDPRMIPDATNTAGLASVGSAGMVPADALGMGIKAYHGSPHSFDSFDMSKIGSGEGAQAYGHGLYFAENEDVAKAYQQNLTTPRVYGARQAVDAAGGDIDKAISNLQADLQRLRDLPNGGGNAAMRDNFVKMDEDKLSELHAWKSGAPPSKGSMYQVDIAAEPEHLLNLDKPLSQQTQHVQDAVKKLLPNIDAESTTGMGAYHMIGHQLGQHTPEEAAMVTNGIIPGKNLGDVVASRRLREAGIPGLSYLDRTSRRVGDGTQNYVVFNDKHVKIDKKYAQPGGTLNKEPDTVLSNIAKLST